jgi:hypothetical protein
MSDVRSLSLCRLVSLVAAAAQPRGGAGCSCPELHPATAARCWGAEQQGCGCGDGSAHRITWHWALLQPGLGLNQPVPSWGHRQHLAAGFHVSSQE